jgi:hypothetical protein
MLLANVAAFATTYYVDPGAGSDANDGLATASAWASIPTNDGGPAGSGWKALVAGDTLWVKGGSTLFRSTQIDSTWYAGGGAGNLISIKSGNLFGWGTGRAIIDGQATPAAGAGVIAVGFHIFAVSYVHIEGFEIRNMKNAVNSAGVYIDGNVVAHDEVVGNVIHEIYGAPGPSGFGIEVTGGLQAGYMLIEKNVIYHTEEKAIELFRQGNCIVRYNYCYETNDHCMVVSSANNVIYDNIFRRAGYMWMQYEFPFRPAFGFKFQTGSVVDGSNADNNIFYNNIVTDCSSGIGLLGCNGNLVAFNTVAFSGFQPIDIAGGPEGAALAFLAQNVAPSNNTVESNIFYYSNISPANTSGSCVFYSTTMGNGNVVTDNDCYMTAAMTGRLFSRDNPTLQMDLATFQGTAGFSSIGTGNVATGNIVAEPQMAGGTGLALYNVSPTGFDASGRPNTGSFMLNSTSPVSVRQGTVQLPAFASVDIVGTTRVNWSLGAYEYVGLTSPPPPSVDPPTTPPPTHLRIKD